MANNVVRTMRGHLRRAGVATEVPLTVHTLRKSFGQNHADAGTTMHVLQAIMGHSSIETTREFYIQTPDANNREAAARYAAIMASSEETDGLLTDGTKKAASGIAAKGRGQSQTAAS